MITIFSLSNEYGESYGLNGIDTGILTDPSKMGYKINRNYTRVGTKWVGGEKHAAQVPITGTLRFACSDPYNAQTLFLDFLRRSKELTIHRTTSAGEYLKDVDVTDYDFGMVKGGSLDVKLTLTPLGLWYSKTVNRYVVTAGTSEYEMRYSFRTSARFNDSSAGSVVFNNNGSVPAPFEMVINGALVNPVITLEQNDVELYRLEITQQLATGDRIEFSSVDDDLYCEKVSCGTRTNLVPTLDIENTNFFKIPVGESVVKISADTALVNPIVFTIYKQYLAV